VIALCIEFVAGSLHAAPWAGSASREEIEWPPSPWQLLQMVASGWIRSGSPARSDFCDLIDVLAAAPAFVLPVATSGRSRHRTIDIESAETDQQGTASLDSAIAIETERSHPARAYAVWKSICLSVDLENLLERCCASTAQIGEHRIALALAKEAPIGSTHYRVDLASRVESGGPIVRRAATGPSLRGSGLLSALLSSCDPTAAVPKQDRHLTLVDYQLPPLFGFAAEQSAAQELEPPVHSQVTFRFHVRARLGSLPPITETLSFAESMRGAVLSRYSNLHGRPAPKRLVGKKENGAFREGHDHPFYLPLDLGNGGFIDAIEVLLPRGCTHDEYLAISRVSRVYDDRRLHGSFELEFAGPQDQRRSGSWSTATPIVLERFAKTRGPAKATVLDSARAEIHRALERRGLTASQVHIWLGNGAIEHSHGSRTRIDAFRRVRLGERVAYPAVGATIEFDRIVQGPIVLGRLSHFGLGRFEPADR